MEGREAEVAAKRLRGKTKSTGVDRKQDLYFMCKQKEQDREKEGGSHSWGEKKNV